MGELKRIFSWSFSRSRILAECPRKYWLHYYGSWGGWAHDATPQQRTAYVLKHLKNRWMWGGEKVHKAIEGVLKDWRKGRVVSPQAVTEQTVDQMRTEYLQSRNRAYINNPKRNCALFEHHYDEDVDKTRWTRVRDDVSRCLDTFFSSSWASELQRMDHRNWLEIEAFGSFELDGVPVTVKLDVAHLHEGGVRVIDWKTGRSQGSVEDENEPLQLALYAMYAAGHFDVTPTSVATVAANLYHGDGEDQFVTPELLNTVSRQVSQSAQAMKMLMVDGDIERNEVLKASCALTDNTATCQRCNFKEVCWGTGWQEL